VIRRATDFIQLIRRNLSKEPTQSGRQRTCADHGSGNTASNAISAKFAARYAYARVAGSASKIGSSTSIAAVEQHVAYRRDSPEVAFLLFGCGCRTRLTIAVDKSCPEILRQFPKP